MQRNNRVRGAVATVVAAAAVGLVAGCDPTATAGAATPAGPSVAASATPTSSLTALAAAPTTTPTASSDAIRRCTAAEVAVSPAHQAAVRPQGTGTGAVVVGVTNTSGHSCTLLGFPTVAGAGNGAPDHNLPLMVHHMGAASAVRLAPHEKAWVKLTFVQVQGEAGGYCVSGATPASYPTIVLGLPGAGAHQIAMDDGVFAECDNTVKVTALSSVRPS
ncbi:hypothetical protein ABIA33_003638 [Streptacidiphilus sp. MAP12-16]|uniref:DUF4232 domain-containing protein n=1 Tax=Streptacidiphilus sp. MAP12-16 TaxID=3156300 RepID=UPI0035132A4B